MTVMERPTIRPTVSAHLLADWLETLGAHCREDQLRSFLKETGLAGTATAQARVAHDQIVRLYQLVAIETGDEMMGLWSRPIRSGALKQLCLAVRGASTLGGALYRFATFWNLLLDDYELRFSLDQRRIELAPRGSAAPNRFGHMLLLKLAHGVASWLAGRELRLEEVRFAFEQPDFAADYAVLFPAPVRFDAPTSAVTFEDDLSNPPVARDDAAMQTFLVRAPRDWIFTSYREHALPLRIRELILRSDGLSLRLETAAARLGMTPRTLIRRLNAEATSFQAIKDGLRRDLSLRDLERGEKSIEAISQDLGFASAANFYRAFRRWTGATPRSYAASAQRPGSTVGAQRNSGSV
ncbi:MAG: AraC family transcriptional regulator ligand-binding domain-containing protein [Pseudomonadota bacterium]